MTPLGSHPGSEWLWTAIRQRSQEALQTGALLPIRTRAEIVAQGGVGFIARVVSSLAIKDKSIKQSVAGTDTKSRAADPFLPYDPDLFVADVSDTHFCLLNKFSVIDNHALIVTRDFQHQESLLNELDFKALWACMAGSNVLGFYNGGVIAGASQIHKHMQMVPLPLDRECDAVPMERRFSANTDIEYVAALPFTNTITWFDQALHSHPAKLARISHERYAEMLSRAGIQTVRGRDGPRQSMPYNLLITRTWMLLIPRLRERVGTISVNALGFAGSFFLRNLDELELLKRIGPMNVLREVAVAKS